MEKVTESSYEIFFQGDNTLQQLFLLEFWPSVLVVAIIIAGSAGLIIALKRMTWGKIIWLSAGLGLSFALVMGLVYTFGNEYIADHIYLTSPADLVSYIALTYDLSPQSVIDQLGWTGVTESDLPSLSWETVNSFNKEKPRYWLDVEIVGTIVVDEVPQPITISVNEMIFDAHNNGVALPFTYVNTWNGEAYTWVSLLPGLFISALQLAIIPFVFMVLISVIANPKSGVKGKTYFWSIFSLMFQVFIGIMVAIVIGNLIFAATDPTLTVPGGIEPSAVEAPDSIWEYVFTQIPGSIATVLSGTKQMVAVVVISIFIGIILNSIIRNKDDAKHAQKFVDLNQSGLKIMNVVIDSLLTLIPFVIFMSVTKLTISDEIVNNFKSIVWFVAAFFVGTAILMLIQILIVGVSGKGKLKQWQKNSADTLLTAFTTQSSSGTLPKTLVSTNLIVKDKSVANLVPPLSTSFGMANCGGFFPSLVLIFTMYVNGEMTSFADAGLSFWIILTVTGLMVSFGAAGVPGTAGVTTITLLTTMGVSTTVYLSTIYFMDQLIDPFRTMTNVNGAMTAAVMAEVLVGNSPMNDAKKAITKANKEVGLELSVEFIQLDKDYKDYQYLYQEIVTQEHEMNQNTKLYLNDKVKEVGKEKAQQKVEMLHEAHIAKFGELIERNNKLVNDLNALDKTIKSKADEKLVTIYQSLIDQITLLDESKLITKKELEETVA